MAKKYRRSLYGEVMTTPEQRKEHKEKRRTKRLAELARKLDTKCRKSRFSLKLVEQAIAKVASENNFIRQYLDAIRRAN